MTLFIGRLLLYCSFAVMCLLAPVALPIIALIAFIRSHMEKQKANYPQALAETMGLYVVIVASISTTIYTESKDAIR